MEPAAQFGPDVLDHGFDAMLHLVQGALMVHLAEDNLRNRRFAGALAAFVRSGE
jgi:hypothetical protein